MASRMSKKHYELIAVMLKHTDIVTDIQRERLAKEFCLAFKRLDHKFDRDKFLEACGIGGHDVRQN